MWEVFEEERPSLQALPPRGFDGYRRDSLRASPTSLIRFDRNRYSVEARAAGRVVELRSYADRIRVYFDDECVADHRRLFGRDQTVFDPWHYLPVLQRKPGALRNGAPFKDWALPVAIERTLERLKSYNDWDRQSVDILAMVPLYGLESVAQACDQALLSGSVSRDRVLNLLSRANEEEVAKEIVSIRTVSDGCLENPAASVADYYAAVLRWLQTICVEMFDQEIGKCQG